MRNVSRRTVLGASAVGTSGVVVAPGAAQGAANAAPPVRSTYAGSVGRVFRVRAGGTTVRLRLTAIRDLAGAEARDSERSFGLELAPVGGATLPDGIYDLRRAGVKTHGLFLSTFGTADAVQAIVNRPR